MLHIIRHPELYRNPVGFVQDFVWEEWQKTGGRKLVFLFPTQTIMDYWEEQLLPTFGSWGGARFLLVDGLVREILHDTRPELADLSPGSSILLLHTIVTKLAQEEKIPYLAQAFPSPGFYAALRQELLVLKRAAINPATLQKYVWGQAAPLQELALIYQLYQQSLTERQVADGEEKLRLATIEAVNASSLAEIEHLFVIGFTDFTGQQENFFRKLGALVNTTVVLDHGLANRKNLPLPTLEGGEGANETIIPATKAENEAPNLLTYLQQALWSHQLPVPPPNPDNSVALLKVKGGYQHEVAYLATEIQNLLKNDPTLTPDEIGIITVYPLAKVAHILSTYALPTTVRFFGPLLDEPAAQALLQPFQVILSDFGWAEMVKFLRWGGVTPNDQLYLAEPPGTLAGWEVALTANAGDQEVTDTLKATSQLLTFLAEIPMEGTERQFWQLALKWLAHPLLLKNFLPKNKTAEPYLQARFLQTSVLGKLRGLLKQMITLVPPEEEKKIRLHDFYIILQSVLAVETNQKPTSWANGIRLLAPSDARGVSFRITMIMGLNEGLVPHLTPESWLLREEITQSWPAKNLFPTNLEQLLRERLLFYYGLNTAREKLILSCCQTNEAGEQMNPSSFWEDLIQLLPAGQQVREGELGNFRLLQPIIDGGDLSLEIHQKIQAEVGRRQAGLAHNGYLGPEETRLLQTKLAGTPLSISALEEYGTCPFGYFCRRWLRIKPLPEPELIPSRLTEGSIAHFILKEFFLRHRGEVLQKTRLLDYTEEIRTLVEEYYPQTAEDGSTLYPSLLLLGKENLISSLTRVIKEEVEWGEKTDGRFTPRYLELGFGGIKQEADSESTTASLVLTIESASTQTPPLALWGKIDRIDMDSAGNFIVYDYKSGNPPSITEVKNGKRLQLPLYLLAVDQLFHPGGKPVGAAYYSLRQTNRLRGIWRTAGLDFGVKIRGALPDEEWDALHTDAVMAAYRCYQGILGGSFPFCPPEQCPPFCEFRPVCRHLIWGKEYSNGTE